MSFALVSSCQILYATHGKAFGNLKVIVFVQACHSELALRIPAVQNLPCGIYKVTKGTSMKL